LSSRAAVAVVLIWALGAAAARALIAAAPAAVAPDLAQPLPVVFGWRLWGVAYLGLVCACAAASAAVLLRSHEGPKPGPATVLAVAAASIAVLCWPAILSSDVYAYAAFGANGSHDPAIALAATWQWGRTLPPDNYGPLFDALAAAVVRFSGDAPQAALAAFRVLACAALSAGAGLIYRLAPGQPPQRAAAALAFGLNPIALWSAAEGHNDLAGIAAVLGAALAARRYPLAGGFAAGCAGLYKALALPAAAVLAVAQPAERRRAFGVGALLGAAVAMGGSLPLLAGAFARAQNGGEHSVPVLYPWYLTWLLPALALSPAARAGSLALAPLALAVYLPDAFGAPAPWLRAGLSAAVAAAYGTLALRAFAAFRREKSERPPLPEAARVTRV
jgi:hypothetical protein